MKLAIVERLKNYKDDYPFNEIYYLGSSYKKIFDELDILLIPVVSEKNLNEICNICDGLIVTGSPNDVHPKYYNDEPIKEKKYDKYDEYDLVKNIIEIFSSQNKPILGICAGIQEINVVFGGTLNQLIPNHYLMDNSTHKIKLNKDSFLYKVYSNNEIEVNSYHFQSVKDLAPNFKITAVSDDGIIEGIENGNIIGVQWHPEVLYDMDLFKSFIENFFVK